MRLARSFRSNFLYPKIYDLINKKLNHRLWPTRLQSRAYKWSKEYETLSQATLVNVGAGPYFNHPNWISLDMIPHFTGVNKNKNKIFCNLMDCLTSFPIKDIDAVYISHCLEHFKLDDAVRLLKAIKQSMKKDAYLRIVVPSFSLILEKIRGNDRNYFAPLFGKNNSSDFMLQDILYAICSPSPQSRAVNGLLYGTIDTKKLYQYSDKELLSFSDKEILDICNNHNLQNNENGQFHLSTYTAKSLITMLSDIGFSRVYESQFMQSSFGPMRETPLFDGTHPWMSLYVEARL